MKPFNLSEWAIKNQSMVLYCLFAILVAGALSYTKLPQKEDPDFTFKVLTVQTSWPGATAREMELQVTDRIERLLQETPWLDNVSSYSKPGESVIFVTLKDEMPPGELPHAWQTVHKHMYEIRDSLPEGVQGPVVNDEYGDTYGSILAFVSSTGDYAAMEAAANMVRQELLATPDIHKIELVGAQREAIYIEFASDILHELGLDPLKIERILKAQNAMESAGEIITADDVTRVRVSGNFDSLQHLQDTSIPTLHGLRRLGDISLISRSFESPAHFKMHFGSKEAVGLSISTTNNGDVIATGRAIASVMDRIRDRLPKGVEVHTVADQPKVVKQSIGSFMKALAEALVIVLLISFLSLGWRAGLVVALSIPVVLAGTFWLMKVFGIDLQRVSIGALIIAIGLLVDDAMIAVEMMKVKLEQGWNRTSAAIHAYQSTAFPMLTGTLITAAAFLPVGLAKSSAGEYTFSICAVVTLSLLVSWLVAVVFTPLLGYHLLKAENSAQHSQHYHSRFYRNFRTLVELCLAWRKTVIAATLACFFLAMIGFTQVEDQFFPPSERPELLLDVWLTEGTAFATTEGIVKEIEKTLSKDSDIARYTSYIGGSTPRFYLPLDLQLTTENYAQIVIEAHDTASRERILKHIRDIIERDYPDSGVRIARLENGPPVGYPIQFWVTGPELEKLHDIATEVMLVVKANPNAKSVSQDSDEPIRALKIIVDEDKARALGVSTQGLSRHLQTLLTGHPVSQFRELDKQIPIVLRAAESDRSTTEFVTQTNVTTDNGRIIPLAEIAKFTETTEPGLVWRMNRQPIITVRADIPDNVQAPEVSQQIDAKLASLRSKLPPGYQIRVAGAMADSDKATDSIIEVLPLTTFLIVSLLMLQLRQFNLTALTLLTAPLGVIGVAGVLLPFHVPFGFVAMLGMISLAGMIIRNSVILVDQIEQDMAQGLSRYDAIVDSTVRRARPILLTAAAAILAMIPLTSSVFWGPMAIVIMGGLLVATLLTLLFLPALYAFWFGVRSQSA